MAKGWADARLADEIGTSRQRISQWVRAVRRPGPDDVRRMEEALGTRLAHHLGYASAYDDGDDGAWTYDSRIASMPPHIREAIDVLITGEEHRGEGATSSAEAGGANGGGEVIELLAASGVDLEELRTADPEGHAGIVRKMNDALDQARRRNQEDR